MKEITSAETIRGKTEIYLDRRLWRSLRASIFYKLKIYQGDYIDDEATLENILQLEYTAAREKAAAYLASRARSRMQIQRALERYNFQPETARRITGEFEAMGLLDDIEYARMLYVTKARAGLGSRRIISQLIADGVDKSDIDSAMKTMDDYDDMPDISENIKKLHDKFMQKYSKYPEKQARQKTIAALIRRGYSYSEISSATGGNDDFYQYGDDE